MIPTKQMSDNSVIMTLLEIKIEHFYNLTLVVSLCNENLTKFERV